MTISRNRQQMLVLRTCNPDMTGHGGFVWPREGHVEAPDWDPRPECGGGLHGLAWGEGGGFHLDWSEDAVWLVVEADQADIVDLGDKIKFPAGNVIYAGTREEAVGRIAAHPEARGRALVGGTATAGDYGTATAGYRGTATAGDGGTATAGYFGAATAGVGGTATAGSYGTATVDDGGTATVGDAGTATAGNYGTATAGNYGTATAGRFGTATAGSYGTVAAGDGGVISIRHVGPDGTLTVHTAAVGGDIRPNILYRLELVDGDVRFATVREEQP